MRLDAAEVGVRRRCYEQARVFKDMRGQLVWPTVMGVMEQENKMKGRRRLNTFKASFSDSCGGDNLSHQYPILTLACVSLRQKIKRRQRANTK